MYKVPCDDSLSFHKSLPTQKIGYSISRSPIDVQVNVTKIFSPLSFLSLSLYIYIFFLLPRLKGEKRDGSISVSFASRPASWYRFQVRKFHFLPPVTRRGHNFRFWRTCTDLAFKCSTRWRANGGRRRRRRGEAEAKEILGPGCKTSCDASSPRSLGPWSRARG